MAAPEGNTSPTEHASDAPAASVTAPPAAAPYADRIQLARAALRRRAKDLHLHRWFPHAPLSLALAGVGLGFVFSTSRADLRILAAPDVIDAAVRSMGQGVLAVPRLLVGGAMLAMSIGLVLRSRFAWVISLLLTAGALLLAVVPHHAAVGAVAVFDALVLLGLLFTHRTFDRSSVAAGTVFALTSGVMLLGYAVFGSYYLGEQFNPPITDLTTALYYAVVTMGTVGYGDISPHTAHAKLFAVSIILLGITVFATALSAIVGPIVGGNLKRILNRTERRMNRKNHFIIVGFSSLARNTYQELRKRNQPVTVIFAQPPPSHDFDQADIIIGDPTNLDVLRQAGAEDAQAVLAMRDDDSENAFIVLAVKELECKAKTIAAVNDSKHLTRIKRVHPDIVLAPQVLGGELLAMSLSGERIDGTALVDRFLHFGS